MNAEGVYIPELHTWLKAIDFYLDELQSFGNRLQEVAGKNTDAATGAAVEHFQNQFIIQKDSLQVLRHDINKQESGIVDDVKKAGRILNIDVVDAEFLLGERMRTQEKILKELKDNFHSFLAKIM